jgi:hypothetical protein
MKKKKKGGRRSRRRRWWRRRRRRRRKLSVNLSSNPPACSCRRVQLMVNLVVPSQPHDWWSSHSR